MQSLMLSLSGTIESMAEFYHVLLINKEKAPRNKKYATCIMKNIVNHFLQICFEFFEIVKFF